MVVAAAQEGASPPVPVGEDFPRGGGGGPIFGMELCRHSSNAGNRGAHPRTGSRPAETRRGAFSSSVATNRRLLPDLRGEAFRDRFLEKGYFFRELSETNRHLRRVRIASFALAHAPWPEERSGEARRRQGANGSAGNAASSRSDSASSTLRPRMVISASTATSWVASSARSLPSRSRARSQSLRASSSRPR